MKLQRRAPVELKPPEAFSRRVLLCVTGLSPQVVTETLYALARQEPAFIPTEVHVITTSTGADMITRKLIARPDGKFHQLCREHIAGHRIRFDNACIHVIKSKGRALSDILTVDDNLAVADTTARVVLEFTSDPHCALHASIAGGRKTMGYYLGYTVSLLGRRQDALSHVLISPPQLESHSEFYFPLRTPVPLEVRSRPDQPAGTPSTFIDPADAEVRLARILFAPLNVDTRDAMLQKDFSQQALVERTMSRFVELPMALYPSRCIVAINGIEVKLTANQMAWLMYFALARRDQVGPRGDGSYTQSEIDWDLFAQASRRVPGSSMPDTRTFTGENLRPFLSKIKSALHRGLGTAFHERYVVVPPVPI